MKYLIILSGLSLASTTFAQVDVSPVDIPLGDQPLMIRLSPHKENSWRFKFSFSNAHTSYSKTDVQLKNSRMDLVIHGAKPYERRSDGYFRVWQTQNIGEAFKWIDEPTNTFELAVEHNQDVFQIRIFHPKYVFVEDKDQIGHHYNENVYVKGELDGQTVDEMMDLHQNPMNINRWTNTYRHLQIELGYGRKMTILRSRGSAILIYQPSVMAGIYTGIRNANWVDPNTGQIVDFSERGPVLKVGMTPMGISGSVANRVTLQNRNDNIGVFVEHKYSYGKLKYSLFDGTAENDLSYQSLSVGLQVTVFKRKRN